MSMVDPDSGKREAPQTKASPTPESEAAASGAVDQQKVSDRRPARSSTAALSLRYRLRLFPITFALIGFTLLVFLGQLLSQMLLGIDLILIFGAKVNELIAAGELWRLITPVLIHGGIGHIFVNMYSLYAIGPAVERAFGPRRMLALYWLSGICGVLFSLAFSTQASVGASGAIFGLLGALGAFFYTNRATFGSLGRFQFRQIVFVALLNLALGLSPGIDNWGHLGGLIFGAGLSWFTGPLYVVDPTRIDQRRLVDQRPWERVWPLVLAGAGLLALLIWAALS